MDQAKKLNGDSISKDLILVGGGHAHVIALRRLAMRPIPGIRISLLSPDPLTPYSGMLPGLLAGHYRFEDTHIDLSRLCQWAGVRFLKDRVLGFDPANRSLKCADRGRIYYDLVSFDIGSQPEMDSVPGAREHAVPVKPVSSLWSRWQTLLTQGIDSKQRIAVVGGGAGSVELALAMAHRFKEQSPNLSLHCAAKEVLPGYASSVRRRATRELVNAGVELFCNERVTRVHKTSFETAASTQHAFSTLLWCTGAAAAPWLRASGAPVDERGFLEILDTLQSPAYPEVFAVGDTAVQTRHPRPKAGVYAVRQGPVLADNLTAYLTNGILKEHRPQTRFLSLLSLGKAQAIAERNGLVASGAWAWRWKDRIDRRFMEQFAHLPAMASRPVGSKQEASDQMPCGGCGAKVEPLVLRSVLEELRSENPAHVLDPALMGDSAVLSLRSPLAQSIDALRSLIDDPWRMGKIAACHALSDLHAANAKPRYAMALVTVPFGSAEVQRRDLKSVLRGALEAFSQDDCVLAGGHSMQGPELQIGFAVSGEIDENANRQAREVQAGDHLLLTKPLGTGVLFAAHMQGEASGLDIESALASMERSNGRAAMLASAYPVNAVTDVTGFGLLVHLLPWLGETLRVELDLASLALLPGALEATRKGVRSTAYEANLRAADSKENAKLLNEPQGPLLFDPQTSGGLLIAVPAEHSDALLQDLVSNACDASDIGLIRTRNNEDQAPVSLRSN
ncbi:MAG: selenide, water dikinase SelD [Pseudomonadota bacterium]